MWPHCYNGLSSNKTVKTVISFHEVTFLIYLNNLCVGQPSMINLYTHYVATGLSAHIYLPVHGVFYTTLTENEVLPVLVDFN